MSAIDKKEGSIGAVMIAAGAAYLYLAQGLPRRGMDVVDSAFVPTVLAVMMCVLGVLQIVAAARHRHDDDTAGGRGPDAGEPKADAGAGQLRAGGSGYLTVLMTLGLIAGYTALLNSVGFPIMTAIYLFLQFLVLTPADARPRPGRYALIAVVAAVSIFATFRYGFELMLPAGWLAGMLG